MKKKIIYFIFFIVLCFIINPCEYKAYQLDCEYKIDTSYEGISHYLWLYFERQNLRDEWKIRYNEKGEYDAWYQLEVKKGGSGNPISLEDYKIIGLSTIDTLCPSIAKFDMNEKTITLSNDIYILNTQKRVDDIPSRYECDYQNSTEIVNSLRKTYNVHFIEENGIYKFNNIYKWDSKTNNTSGVDRNVVTEGLVHIEMKKDNGEILFNHLVCPSVAIDDGTKVTLENNILYNLDSSKYNNELSCNYYNKTNSNIREYKINFKHGETTIVTRGKYPLIGIFSVPNLQPIQSGVCPLTLRVKDDVLSFSNVSYFYLTSDSSPFHCMEITNESSCKVGTENYACVWVEDESLPNKGYCNINKLQFVACNNNVYDIPLFIPSFTSFIVNLLKIAAPIILIVVSIISLLKALAASNEDEIKKAQKSLIRKIIASVLVFFVISIVQFVIMKVADDGESGNIDDCLTCLLNNDCKTTTYYKADVFGKPICRYLSGDVFKCPGTENNVDNNNTPAPSTPNPNNNRVDMIN